MSNHKANPHAFGTAAVRRQCVRDAYARELAVGDETILPSLRLPRFRIQELRPAFEPGAPPNTMVITLGAQIRIVVAADTPFEQILRIRTNAELEALGVPAPTAPEPLPGDQSDLAKGPDGPADTDPDD